MTSETIDALIKACDTLTRRVTEIGGRPKPGSATLFDYCMRVFTAKVPAESITFSVFINAPVMQDGEATIYRDGRLEMRTV